jgi:EF hand
MKSIASFRPRGLHAALLVAALGGALATASFAQSPAMPATPASPATASQPASKIVPPIKSETPDSAFKKLDPGTKGYVSKEDAAQVPGFDAAFQRADANGDGKLSPSEFNQAWSIYSGTTK